MIPVADPFMAGIRPSGLQRGRGGFLRSADDAPYVSDPSGDTVASGARKGEVKRLKYGSPSNRGREIENDAGLVKYKQRLSLVGIGMSDDLAQACKALVDLPVGSPEFNSAADAIAVEADKLTRSSLAADRGTHGHALTEFVDRWIGPTWTPPVDLIPLGETVGLDQTTQLAVVKAWSRLLTDNGLRVLAIEASCVDDRWRLAGTLDRIVRTTKPLTFVKPGGELVVIPADTVIVLDIKFGRCRLAHPIQIASYAQSVPYDTETEVRGEWPWPIDQTHALIAHGDFGDEFRPPSMELVWVDLVAGREHGGETVAQAKAWSARGDVFSVAQIVEGAGHKFAETPSVHPGKSDDAPSTLSSAGAPVQTAPLTAGEDEATPSAPSPAMFQESHGTSGEVADAVDAAAAVDPSEGMAPEPFGDCQDADSSASRPNSTCTNPRCESGYIVDNFDPGLLRCPTCQPIGAVNDRLALVDARNQLTTEPDQGADLSVGFDELWDQLHTLFQDLPPDARRWRSEMVMQATQRHVPFNVQTVKTERTYHLNSAIIGLAIVGMTDEVLRGILALVVGDIALFPSIQTGHLVGSLSVKEAERFAELADAYIGDRLESYVDDGCLRYREPFSPPPAA